MKKMNLTCALALAITAGTSSTANAALADSAVLNIGEGSFFGLDLDGNGIATAAEGAYISQSQGIKVGAAQLLPTIQPGTQPLVIDEWQGSPGTHWTQSPSNILTDDGQGTVTLDLSGWNMWDGIQNIFLGSGAWEAGSADGVAQIRCGFDCSNGDTYTLSYFATVPIDDPSGFGDKLYALHINGTVSVVPVPAAVWLFGSGLLGLAGIVRRRKVSA